MVCFFFVQDVGIVYFQDHKYKTIKRNITAHPANNLYNLKRRSIVIHFFLLLLLLVLRKATICNKQVKKKYITKCEQYLFFFLFKILKCSRTQIGHHKNILNKKNRTPMMVTRKHF